MTVSCVCEHNGNDTLLHAIDFPGAYSRGKTLEIAIGKMDSEVRSYLLWKESPLPQDIQIHVSTITHAIYLYTMQIPMFCSPMRKNL